VPSVLVDQLVVEGADEREVVEVGAAAPRPPSDVVRVREAPVAAARDVQVRSRCRSCRIIHADGSRTARPRPTTEPSAASRTVCSFALQRRRRTLSMWRIPPPSVIALASASASASAWTCTTTVERSAEAPPSALHSTASASALRAPTSRWPSSPGISGISSARRSSASVTIAPCAAGSSPSSRSRRPSSVQRHASQRSRSICSTSVRAARRSSSPRRQIAPGATSWDHASSGSSSSGVAKGVSSTTLSMASSPFVKDDAIRGSADDARPEATQRSAFHHDMPNCIDTQWAMSCAPSSSQASRVSNSARLESNSLCAAEIARCSSWTREMTASVGRSERSKTSTVSGGAGRTRTTQYRTNVRKSRISLRWIVFPLYG
jgi:hypothetical protein